MKRRKRRICSKVDKWSVFEDIASVVIMASLLIAFIIYLLLVVAGYSA